MKKNEGWSVVVLHFGYVESSQVSVMVFENRHGHESTKLDAVRGVANWFMRKWLEDHEWGQDEEPEKCCQKARAKKRPPKFCPDCGTPTQPKQVFDVESYQGWLLDVQGRTADDFGWDGGMDDEEPWYPWGAFRRVMQVDRVVEIVEHAEEVLTYALRPSDLPDGIAEEIKSYRESMVENHAANRLDKKGLDADGLVDFDAKARVRGVEPGEDE